MLTFKQFIEEQNPVRSYTHSNGSSGFFEYDIGHPYQKIRVNWQKHPSPEPSVSGDHNILVSMTRYNESTSTQTFSKTGATLNPSQRIKAWRAAQHGVEHIIKNMNPKYLSLRGNTIKKQEAYTRILRKKMPEAGYKRLLRTDPPDEEVDNLVFKRVK